MSQQRLRIRIQGRVQGVGFRWFALDVAQRLGITGFVRNVEDGSLLVEAQADERDLFQYCDALRNGPNAAHVSEFLSDQCTISLQESGFRIEP